jgi:hypothetical protein
MAISVVVVCAQGASAGASLKAGCPGAPKTSQEPAAAAGTTAPPASTTEGNAGPVAPIVSPAIVAVGGVGGDGKVVFRFGHDRPCQTRRITFQIAGESTSPTAGVSAAVVGDLLSSDGTTTIPFDETGVTPPSRDANGNYSLNFGVHVHHEGSGEYSGLLQITAPGARPLSIPIDITLRSGPAWAIGWLIVGLLIGYLVKWWGASGSTLEQQLPRLELVDRRMRSIPASVLPDALVARRDDADRAIANWDAAAAKAALDDIQTHMEAIVGVATTAQQLLERLEVLRAGRLQLSNADLVDKLAGEIRKAARTAWDDAAKALAAVNDLTPAVTAFEGVATASDERDKLTAILHGDQALEVAAERIVRDEQDSEIVVEKERHHSSRLTTLQKQVLRRTGIVLFLITLTALTLYGYSTLYDKKSTFGAAGLSDWITLGGWGFATALAGKTITDYFGPGVPSSPELSPTQR